MYVSRCLHGAMLLALGASTTERVDAQQMSGINVLLRDAPTSAVLAELGLYGEVLDVLPEIRAVTLRASGDRLPALRALPSVAAVNLDARRYRATLPSAPRPLSSTALASSPACASNPASAWSLDAINVTDFGVGRTVGYDGEGVYIAVLDTGLMRNWREYFPEDRIATQFARGISGGGGLRGHISSQPNSWEHDREWHGTAVTSILLGFRYLLEDPPMPATFDGVAPKATIIPIADLPDDSTGYTLWSSTATRSVLYVVELKRSGALGDAPVVINMSQGGPDPDSIERAAIDYAISNGIVFVSGAGNEASAGMRYPGAYAPVICAAASGNVAQYPTTDPTTIAWALDDFPENEPLAHFIAPFSSWPLAGQDVDVAAPGHSVPAVVASQSGQVDYSFFFGTSAAAPHVAGVVALMLQKNPTLTAAEIETILETTATPLAPGCREVIDVGVGKGNFPTWSDHSNVFFFETTYCWPAAATGHGLLDAQAALLATPFP